MGSPLPEPNGVQKSYKVINNDTNNVHEEPSNLNYKMLKSIKPVYKTDMCHSS